MTPILSAFAWLDALTLLAFLGTGVALLLLGQAVVVAVEGWHWVAGALRGRSG